MVSQGSKRLRTRWIAASLVLHTALLGFATLHRAPTLLHLSHRADPKNQELDIDFALPPEPERQSERQPDDALAARPAASNSRAVPHLANSKTTDEGIATSDSAPTDDTAPPSPDEGTADGTGTDATPDTSQLGPRLSLTDLGVGDRNPFVVQTPAQKKADKARAVKKRLDRALAQGLLDHDSKQGRGAGGPVMRILEALTYASSAPSNGNASFTFVIDADGKVVSGTLGATSTDREAWERVARQAVSDLANHKLQVPKGKSVRLTVQVVSRLEMPSGADPGVEVRTFGIPVKRGDGPRSTRVDILNPLNPLAPLSLLGDPADVGAKPRRMVRAHVTSEELL